jgi:hypothetical protein
LLTLAALSCTLFAAYKHPAGLQRSADKALKSLCLTVFIVARCDSLRTAGCKSSRLAVSVPTLQGRSGQLGAEGFVMGSSYLFFSTTLASLTYVVPRIRSSSARGIVSLVLVLLAAFTAMRILSTYGNKTGIHMRTFFSFYH